MLNKALFTSKDYEWETPQDFFDELNKEFHFHLDPCATRKNSKCGVYFDKEIDGLKQTWHGNVFMNPPYGRKIINWVKKAYEESRKEDCDVVVCLLPARTDTKWFHDYCLKGEIRFIRGRLYFSNADRAPFPSMIVIFRKKNV